VLTTLIRLRRIVLYQMSYFRNKKNFKSGCKNKQIIYTWEYTGYFPVQVLQVYCSAWYKAYNSRQIRKLLCRLPGDKIKMLKMKPSYVQNPYPVSFATLY
jgi:hypothetical protein